MIKFIFKNSLHIILLYTLMAFPLFYFVYKFGVLLAGYEDAKSYFKLFADLSSKEVPSPFNMRLVSPLLIQLLHKTGLFYNTECAMDAFPQFDKTYFFSNVFYNFLCVILTCFSLFVVFSKLGFSQFLSFTSGLLYLLGFGTVFYMMMPGVDALSVLIFTWLLYFYLKKSYMLIPLLLLLIFQREYYFLVLMVMTIMDYFKYGKIKYYLHVFLVATFCWTVYFLLRKYVFMTPHWHYQTKADRLIDALLNIRIDLVTMARQTLMTMNIYFIYILILLHKKSKGYKINMYYLYMTLILFVQITILSIATTSGNNNGRYFYFATPFFLYLILLEVSTLINFEFTESQKKV